MMEIPTFPINGIDVKSFQITVAIFIALIYGASAKAQSNQEISLFDSEGNASAYIAISDDMTIYTWNGAPVAYLDAASTNTFNVYGFNGSHLGWFIDGVIWDHDGNAACAIGNRVSHRTEPFKSFKQFKPFKSFKEFAPYMPHLSNQFGSTNCTFLLLSGSSQ